MIQGGLSEEEANQFLQDNPETITVIAELQAVRTALESGDVSDQQGTQEERDPNVSINQQINEELSSELSLGEIAVENGANFWEREGQTTVQGTQELPTATEAAVQALGDGQRYMDWLYEENPTAARLTEIAITGALGGPVKAVVTVPVEYALEQAMGDEMAAAMDTVTDYAGAAVTDQEETSGEFRQDTQINGYEGDQARIKDGARFVISTVLGVGLPGKGQGDLDVQANNVNERLNEAGDSSNITSGNDVVRVDTENAATRGTSDYEALNDSAPNTHYELDNGTTFKTNDSGYVEEITFNPALSSGTRDTRQTAVGKEGLPTDVGGHIQACSMGGTCDRFNLFPQDSNFNNGEYKKWENEIRNSLKNGDEVGPITVRFERSNSSSARPDSLDIEYTINGVVHTREFRNQPGG